GARRYAVRGLAADAVRLHALDRGLRVVEGPPHRDRVTHRRLLDVRRDDPHLTELPGDASERHDPRAEDAVVVADQDPHLLNSNSSYRPRVGRRASRAGEHHSVTLTARSRKGCEDYPDVGPPLADTRRNDHFSSSSSR